MRVHYIIRKEDRHNNRINTSVSYSFDGKGLIRATTDRNSVAGKDKQSRYEVKVLVVNCNCGIIRPKHRHIMHADVFTDRYPEFDSSWVDYGETDDGDDIVESNELPVSPCKEAYEVTEEPAPPDHVKAPDGRIVHVEKVQPTTEAVNVQGAVKSQFADFKF